LDKKAARLFDPETPGPADPQATYVHYWRECGGAQSLEELENLSNECARVCNQRRAKLVAGARERVDRAIADLAPTFDGQVLSSNPQVIARGIGLSNQPFQYNAMRWRVHLASLGWSNCPPQKRSLAGDLSGAIFPAILEPTSAEDELRDTVLVCQPKSHL